MKRGHIYFENSKIRDVIYVLKGVKIVLKIW